MMATLVCSKAGRHRGHVMVFQAPCNGGSFMREFCMFLHAELPWLK